MRPRHALPIVCAALLVLSTPAGADDVPPPPKPPSAAAEPVVAADPVVAAEPIVTAPSAEAPAATPTALPQATPPPGAESVATPEATAPPQPTSAPTEDAAATPDTSPPPHAAPAPTPPRAANSEAAPPPQATLAAAPAATQQVSQPPTEVPGPIPPGPTPPSGCATPVEPSVGDECRVPSSVCSVFGTDGDDVRMGTPFADILCGFGGNDRLDGGEGDDVLLGGDGDDVLLGGEGTDCMVGGPGTDSADTTPGEFAEVEQSADNEPTGDVQFDAAGNCIAGVKPDSPGAQGQSGHEQYGFAQGQVQGGIEPTRPQLPGLAPEGSAPVAGIVSVAASGSRSGLADLRLPRGARAVRRGIVRLRVSCSAFAPGELVLLAGSRRIAYRRFACRPPGRTVRVRLNDAGRRFLTRDDRVRVRMLVLAGGRTVSRRVLLVTPRG